jgi:hypothetical protein
MPYACSYEVPADEQLYQRVLHEIGNPKDPRMLVHLVVKSAGGLRHIEVWQCQADWERFRDERVRPAVGRVLQAAGMSHMPPPPDEEELQVVDVLTG